VLLIFGFTVRFKATSTQPFFCPTCGGDRVAVVEVARRWFTLFLLPLIPMKELGQRVRCETCGSSFDPSVLDQPTTAQLGTLFSNAVRALTAMVVGAGAADAPAMRAAAIASVHRYVPGYDAVTLQNDLAQLHPIHAAEYVSPLAGVLEVAGQEQLLGDIVAVALADGAITAPQRRIIDDVGTALGLTPTHVIGIIAATASAPAPDDEAR
jgi:hypothetical protein